jgi:hypothetical protein
MIVRAFTGGLRRVAAAPWVLAGMFVMTFVMAVPLALVLRGSIEAHLGSSMTAGAVADGVEYDWWQEFSSQASGLATTFTPTILGFAAVLDNISSVLDGDKEIVPIAGALAAYVGVWTFLLGGIIDRYARQRATRAHGFFSAAGVYFFRFLRLGIIAALLYWLLFHYVHTWLFDTWFDYATRDVDTERVAFAWRMLMYAIFGALLVIVNVVVSYAKVRLVVEDRRSAIGAFIAALRFCWRRKREVIAVYGLNLLLFAVVIAVWALVSPGASGAGPSMWVRFIAGQVYILARLAIQLQVVASHTALFQTSLAHARYTAAPVPVWPESPAAETVSTSA